MGVEGFGNIGKRLQGEGHFAIVPEERGNGVQFGWLFLEKQVRDGHLGDSQHAPPAGVGLVVGGREDFLDIVAVGKADILFVVLYFLAGEECEKGSEHSYIILITQYL
jgi:hypothetical protein